MNTPQQPRDKIRRRRSAVLRSMPQPAVRLLKSTEARIGRNPQFVILSTGRAGSNFTQKLLDEVGVPCTHERFFTPFKYIKRFQKAGESSWLAVPYLENKRPSRVGPIVHQVRHPLAVISSLYGIRFFSSEIRTLYQRFAKRHVLSTGDELTDCMRWWTHWNLRCEKLAELTFRVEDLATQFSIVLSHLGYSHWGASDWSDVVNRLTGKKVNARKRCEITLSDLPDNKDKDGLIALATRYGYEL